jgi:hypothetical protein
MDSTDLGGAERDRKVEIDLNDGPSVVTVITQVLVSLAEMRTELQHLTKLAETHGRERSHMGERVGTLERAVPEKLTERLVTLEKAVPEKLAERLGRLETRNGQLMLLGSLLIVVWPMVWGEIRRPDVAPSHVRVVVPTRQGP